MYSIFAPLWSLGQPAPFQSKSQPLPCLFEYNAISTLFLEPVRPTILGPIQVHDDPNDENAVVLRVEYDAVPEPEVTWMKDDQPLNDLSGIEVRFIFEDSLFISIIKDCSFAVHYCHANAMNVLSAKLNTTTLETLFVKCAYLWLHVIDVIRGC